MTNPTKLRIDDTVRLTRAFGPLAEGEHCKVTGTGGGTVTIVHADGRSAVIADGTRIALVERAPLLAREFVAPCLFLIICLAFGLWQLLV